MSMSDGPQGQRTVEGLALDLAKVNLAPLPVTEIRTASQVTRIDINGNSLSNICLSPIQLKVLMDMVSQHMDLKARNLFRNSSETNEEAKLRFAIWFDYFSRQIEGDEYTPLIMQAGMVVSHLKAWNENHKEVGSLNAHHWANVMNIMLRNSGYRYYLPLARGKDKAQRQGSRRAMASIVLLNAQIADLFQGISEEFETKYLSIIQALPDETKRLQNQLLEDLTSHFNAQFQKVILDFIGQLIQSGEMALAEVFHQWLYFIKQSAMAQASARGEEDSEQALHALMVKNGHVMPQFLHIEQQLTNVCPNLAERYWPAARTYYTNAIFIAAIKHSIFDEPFDVKKYALFNQERKDLEQVEAILKKNLKKKLPPSLKLERRGSRAQLQLAQSTGTTRPRRNSVKQTARSFDWAGTGSSAGSFASTSDISSDEGGSTVKGRLSRQASAILSPRGSPLTGGTPRSARGRAASTVSRSSPRLRFLKEGEKHVYDVPEIKKLLTLFAAILNEMEVAIGAQSFYKDILSEIESKLLTPEYAQCNDIQGLQPILTDYRLYARTNAGVYFIALVGRAIEKSNIFSTSSKDLIALTSILKMKFMSEEVETKYLLEYIGTLHEYMPDLVELIHHFLHLCHAKVVDVPYDDSPIASAVAEVLVRLLNLNEFYEDKNNRAYLQQCFYALVQYSRFAEEFKAELYQERKLPATYKETRQYRLASLSGSGSVIDRGSLRQQGVLPAPVTAETVRDALLQTLDSAGQAVMEHQVDEELIALAAGTDGSLTAAFEKDRGSKKGSRKKEGGSKKDKANEDSKKKKKKR